MINCSATVPLRSKLTKVGGVLVVADIALSGEIKPSHVINSIMLGLL